MIAHYNIVIVVIRKTWWIWYEFCKLTYLCCCHVYLSAVGLVVYCLVKYVVAARTRIAGLVHWPAIPLLVCCIGGRFEYTCFPSGSFCCFFLHGFINCSVFSVVPYSWLLFNICTAYADAGLLFFMYFYMFFVPCCDWSTGLSHVIHSTCIILYFVYPTWVFVACFLH